MVHGIPNDRPLENGDIVSVDCGVLMNGFYGDSAYTFEVGEVSPEIKALLKVTKESLDLAIEQAVVGKRIGTLVTRSSNTRNPMVMGWCGSWWDTGWARASRST